MRLAREPYPNYIAPSLLSVLAPFNVFDSGVTLYSYPFLYPSRCFGYQDSMFFSHSPPSMRNWQTQVQVQRLRPPFTTNPVYTQCTIEESFIYYYACSPRFISALVSTFSLLVPRFVGCRQSLLSPVNLVSSRLVSSRLVSSRLVLVSVSSLHLIVMRIFTV